MTLISADWLAMVHFPCLCNAGIATGMLLRIVPGLVTL
jgi:hypothetical protein